jgi:hypothetical protein
MMPKTLTKAQPLSTAVPGPLAPLSGRKAPVSTTWSQAGGLDGDGLWDLQGRTGKGTPVVYSGNDWFGPPEGHRRVLTRGMPSPR